MEMLDAMEGPGFDQATRGEDSSSKEVSADVFQSDRRHDQVILISFPISLILLISPRVKVITLNLAESSAIVPRDNPKDMDSIPQPPSQLVSGSSAGGRRIALLVFRRGIDESVAHRIVAEACLQWRRLGWEVSLSFSLLPHLSSNLPTGRSPDC
jgi:hypothetical protein